MEDPACASAATAAYCDEMVRVTGALLPDSVKFTRAPLLESSAVCGVRVTNGARFMGKITRWCELCSAV